MISFQKIYDLHGLEHHTVEKNWDVTMRTDERTSELNIELITQSMDSVRLSFAIMWSVNRIRITTESNLDATDLLIQFDRELLYTTIHLPPVNELEKETAYF